MERLRDAIARSIRTLTSVPLEDDASITIQEWPLDSYDAPLARRWSVDEFEQRCLEILELGTLGWINLNLVETSAERARFVVEYFEEPQNGRRYSPEHIVVNVSGPLLGPR